MALDSTDPSYWPTTYIAIVPRVSGSVSAISSSIIIYLVFQSAARLSTIYHRIMFCMSVSDIILSVGYALTSLPMPAEMPMEEELGIYWPGPRYGNTTTCNIQGFMTTFGATSMLGYITTLCMCKFRMPLELKTKLGFSILCWKHVLFFTSHFFNFLTPFSISPDYACAIGLNLPEKIIRNVVQPVVLGFPIICGLYASILSIYLDLNNPPSNMSAAWCTTVPYPSECYTIGDNEVSCIVGTISGYDQVQNIFNLLIQIGFIIIFLSMLIVLSRAICNYRHEIIGTHSNDVNEAESPISPIRSNQEGTTSVVEVDDFECGQSLELDDNSIRSTASRRNRPTNMLRAIALQAISYIASFLLGTIWRHIPRNTYGQRLFRFKLGLVLVPLTGFFNMLVFLSSKVYAHKRAHGDHVSNRDILKMLFTKSIDAPVFIHGISMVDGDYIERKIRQLLPNLQKYSADGTEKRRDVTFAKAESENYDDDHPVKAPSGVSSGVSSRDLSFQINDGELYDLSGCSVSGIYSSRPNDSSVLSFAGTDKGTLSSSARN